MKNWQDDLRRRAAKVKSFEKVKFILLSMIPLALWGSLFPCIKLGYQAFNINSEVIPDILMFASVRFILCGILITAFALVKKEKVPTKMSEGLGAVLLTGLFCIILHYAFTYIGLSLADSSKTAILKQLGTLFYICFAYLFVKEEKFSVNKIIGAILGFSGIVAINSGGGKFTLTVGDVMIILASVCTVVGSLTTKSAMKNVPPIMTTGISQLFGGVALFIGAIVMGGKINFTWSALPIFAYICIASIIAYSLWNYIINKAELSKMFIIKFAEPMFACIFGAILLGENILKWQYAVSFLLISAGIVLGNLKNKE